MEQHAKLQKQGHEEQKADQPDNEKIAAASSSSKTSSERSLITELPTDLHYHTLTFLRRDSAAAFHRCAHSTIRIFGEIRSLHFEPAPTSVRPDVDEIILFEAPLPRVKFLLSSLPSLTLSTLARHLDHVSFDGTMSPFDRSDITKVKAIFEAEPGPFAMLSPYLRSLDGTIPVSHHKHWWFPPQLRQLNLRLHLHDFVMTACFTGEEHEDHFVHFFDCLQYLTQLEVLSLAWFDHSTNGESTFNLKKKFAAPSIRPLMKLQTLRSLELGTSNLLPDAILVASSLPRLTTFLTPSATQVDLITFSLTPIATRIERLDTATGEMKNLPSQILTRFTSLTRLDLPCDYECADYSFLTEMTQLQSIRFSYDSFNGVLPSPETMRQMTHLTHFTLEWKYKTPSRIRVFEMLIECVHLTHLNIRLTYGSGERMNEDRLTQLLASLPRLQKASFTSYFDQEEEDLPSQSTYIVDRPPISYQERTAREAEYDKRMNQMRSSSSEAISHTFRSLTIYSEFYITLSRLASALPALEYLTLQLQPYQSSLSSVAKYFSTVEVGSSGGEDLTQVDTREDIHPHCQL